MWEDAACTIEAIRYMRERESKPGPRRRAGKGKPKKTPHSVLSLPLSPIFLSKEITEKKKATEILLILRIFEPIAK